MKLGLYFKLACDGIRKNQKIYLPYLMTSSLMVAVLYIIVFLSRAETVSQMEGGGTTQAILALGSVVIRIFALIFLFYTNSFLMRRRRKEFGLYNMLGMNKRNIGRILFFETAISFAFSTLAGLAAGIAFSKLSELCLLKLVNADVSYQFAVDSVAIWLTVPGFVLTYALILAKNLIQIGASNPMELAKSETVGEKPPKANFLLGFAGIVILVAAYGLALAIQQPLEAIIWFFIAVVMVIIATYLLFVSGSVLLCRILQKNKAYYYQKKHFVAVSSMTYRMKRNGAGLASICVLLTMVLVMISSTACLYIGSEDSLDSQYPREICNLISHYGYEENQDEINLVLKEKMEQILADNQVSPQNISDYVEYNVTGLRDKDYVDIDAEPSAASINEFHRITEVHFIDLKEYNAYTGSSEVLSDGEAIVCAVKTDPVNDCICVGEKEFQVAKQIRPEDVDFYESDEASIYGNLFVIVPNIKEVLGDLTKKTDLSGRSIVLTRWHYDFDMGGDLKKQEALLKLITDTMDAFIEEEIYTIWNAYYSCKESEEGDFYGVFGGLFFIGILLSILFLIAAVLIIYYKQITEGYEDRARFEIMQKVGMTKKDIRETINSQMFTVFLLPILFAALHTGFAFPIVKKLLMLFGLFNTPLLIQTTAISILICAAFYMIVYRITSEAYYTIVE